ncbi:MAG: hypothetical protein JNL28_01250 [Planctomycetes bacterium]|nr:hypothetical protein [Planctomycetota bacterium]
MKSRADTRRRRARGGSIQRTAIISLLALSLALLAGCTNDASVPPIAVAPLYPKLGVPMNAGQPDLSSVNITLSRSTCYGTCPAYNLTLSGTGEGVYEGLDFVVRKGLVSFHFEPSALLSLLDTLEALDYMQPRPIEDGTGIDAQTVILVLTVGGHSGSYGTFWLQNFEGDPNPTRADFNRRFARAVEAVDRIAEIETFIGDERARELPFAR